MSQPPNFFFDRVIDTLRPFCFGRHHRSTTTVLRILTVVGDQNPRDGSDPPLILQAKQNSFFGAGGWPFFLSCWRLHSNTTIHRQVSMSVALAVRNAGNGQEPAGALSKAIVHHRHECTYAQLCSNHTQHACPGCSACMRGSLSVIDQVWPACCLVLLTLSFSETLRIGCDKRR